MAFQTSVNARMGAGIPGELAFEGPLRATPAMLDSTAPANNVFGRFFTDRGTVQADPAASAISAQAGGTGAPIGFLANPKEHVLAEAQGFNPTNALPNGVVASFVSMGYLFVTLTNDDRTAAPGDQVAYQTATGELISVAPGDAAPAGAALIPTAIVYRYRAEGVEDGALAVIRVTDPNLQTPAGVTP